jgi:putative protease
LSNPKLLNVAFDTSANWIIIQATQPNLHFMFRRKPPSGVRDRLFLSLPPIISDDNLPFYRDQIRRLQRLGHSRWLVANWGHFRLFTEPTEVLLADYTFNVLNSQASSLLKEMGCQALILSLENDRDNLRKLVPAIRGITPLATVHGWPPLFISRLKVKPREDLTIRGPNREQFQYRRQGGLTEVRSEQPLCLLEHLNGLNELGLKGFVIDLRGQKLRANDLHAVMKSAQRQVCPRPYTTFNYLGKLV